MNENSVKIQDKNSKAWLKLCEYIEKVVEDESEQFIPSQYLSEEEYLEILTLPKSISKLKKVKKAQIYGSNIVYVPPEIGEMDSLEDFIPYTSYRLNWFPYEISKCKNLVDSCVSTRAIYGNIKNRMEFPDLSKETIKYDSEKVSCSLCAKEMSWEETDQYWTMKWIGTDDMPLLVNTCSKECLDAVPDSREIYILRPHKGGEELAQPEKTYWDYASESTEQNKQSSAKDSGFFKWLKGLFR